MKLTALKQHVKDWQDCRRCELHKTRRKVVLYSATKLPCPILFIGQDPGKDENNDGRPFVGKAGQMLRDWIEDLPKNKYAMINLLGCIAKELKPVESRTGKVVNIPVKSEKPPAWALKECRPRVEQFIRLCQPEVVVCVGEQSKKLVRKYIDSMELDCEIVDIYHPARILQMDQSQVPLAVQRSLIVLEQALAKYL